MSRLRQTGVTLVELIIAVVIISVAVTGILMAYVQMVRNSADPMIEAQALAIAEGLMDEILAKPVAGTPGCVNGAPRQDCALVGDYDGLVISGVGPDYVSDQLGNTYPQLAGYAVAVNVGPGAEAVGTDAVAGDASVTITVVRGATTIQLRGYKVDY